MVGASFSAAEFVTKLREGHFRSAPLMVTGLVKPSEDDADALLIAHPDDCINWTKIPVPLLENVQFLRIMPCKDHSHPLVTLIFRIPHSEVQTFVGITKLMSAASSSQQASRTVQMLGDPASGNRQRHHALIAQHHALLAQHHALIAQQHSLMETFDPSNTRPPDANGKCPDGYYYSGLGLGCSPGAGGVRS